MKIAGGKSRRGQRVLVHPAAEKKPTKLSRLAPRDTIVGTVEDLERAREELDDDMRTRWGTKASATSSKPMCDLDLIFGDITARLPDDPEGSSEFVFHAGVLPIPPAALSSDRITIRKLTHNYDSCYRADALWMSLSLRKCRELGVFLLACAFHGPLETTTLTIAHPDSAIRRIIIPAGKLVLEDEDLPVGLSMVPFALRYSTGETEKHPWMYDSCTHDLPLLVLSNENDCVGPSEEDWRRRDTVRTWASSPGTLRLAELLLNAGCSWNPVREYALEGDAGYRGVAPMSAELRIFLPGSDGWIYQDEDVPVAGDGVDS